MSKTKLAKVIKDVRRGISKHSPEILTAVGIAGMITTTVLAVKATPKAIELLEEIKADEDLELECKKLSAKDVIKTCWKCYIPATVTGMASITCLIGACSVNSRRNAALAAAYELSRTALNEYKDKVIETVGEKKEQAIKDAVAKEQIAQTPVSTNEVFITGKGNTLFLDGITKRYFRFDYDKIKRVENELNERLLREDYISLNDFYDAVGISHSDLGDDLGWNVGRDGLISLDLSAQISEDGEPCIVVGYRVAPRREYHKYW